MWHYLSINVLAHVSILSTIPMSIISSTTRGSPILTLRIIKPQLHIIFLTSRCKFFDNIPFKWGGIDYIERIFRLKHGKSFMMLTCQNHIFHSRFLSKFHPFLSIVLYGIKLIRVIFVNSDRYLTCIHYPFTNPSNLFSIVSSCRNTIQSPMNKHSKSCVLPPIHLWIISHCYCVLGK